MFPISKLNPTAIIDKVDGGYQVRYPDMTRHNGLGQKVFCTYESLLTWIEEYFK